MVTTAEALTTLYPTGIPLVDYEVRSDGAGGPDVIFNWNEAKLGPQPTQADLDAVTTQQATTARRAKFPLLRDLLDDATAAIQADQAYAAIADTATNVQVREHVKKLNLQVMRIIQANVYLIKYLFNELKD